MILHAYTAEGDARSHTYSADVDLTPDAYPADMLFFLSTDLMHVQPIRLQAGIFLSTPLSHTQPMLQKTPVNDLDNHVLLLRCHLVIARKT